MLQPGGSALWLSYDFFRYCHYNPGDERTVNFPVNFADITTIMANAHDEGRSFLYEYEVYSLLSCSGAETVPKFILVQRNDRISDDDLQRLPGDKVVIKIVSPTIMHKTEVQGVQIVERQPDKIRSAIRRMLYEAPENYAAWLERNREDMVLPYRGLAAEDLTTAVGKDIKGVLLVQYMPPDSEAFGNELIVSLRATREFGMVITAGLGGTDTELYASRFRKDQAVVAGSTKMHDGGSFFRLFRRTIAYRKLAGLTRGQRRIVTDEQLVECFDSFIRMGNYYSPPLENSEFQLEELEVNPFAFSDYLMIPLDGLCSFSSPSTPSKPRPAAHIEQLLHPERIGIIGVSSSRRNFGRIILDNILAEGFSPESVTIIHERQEDIAGVSCLSSLEGLQEPFDLLIVAVGAAHVPDLIDQIILNQAAVSVMLISGGLGETDESKERAERVINSITRSREKGAGYPVVLGANCMGVISHPGRYDTWFIPEEKLPKVRSGGYRRSALISQSGAFMLHRSHQCPELKPAYMISMGNQTDLTLGDMVKYFKDSDKVDVIAVYAEGFNDDDGLEFCLAVREAVIAGKEVIFYKAGRTPEGKAATSGHTASLAGDYMVCESCVRQAGAMVARTFSEFQELFFLAETQSRKTISGNRLAAVSGAGFEAVGMADSIESDDYHMQLAGFSGVTNKKIKTILTEKGLQSLVTVVNPLDINPAADDETHALIAEAILDDTGVDAIVMSLDPLSPAMRTLHDPESSNYDMEEEGSIKARVIALAEKSDKPIVTVVDGGRMFDPLRDSLIEKGIPVFKVCDHAVAVLSLYIQGRLMSQSLRKQV